MLNGRGGAVVLGALALATASRCGDGNGDDTEPRVVSVALTPSAATIGVGDEQAFAARAIWTDGSTQNVTGTCVWSSDDPYVATVDATGVASGISPGTAEVSCTFEGVSGAASLTVADIGFIEVIVEPPYATICPGDTAVFTARRFFDDGTDEDLTDIAVWASSDEWVATVDGGFVTGVGMGTATVTATFGGVESNPATVIVNSCGGLESIQITPASAAIGVGMTQRYLAIGVWASGTSEDLTADVEWTSSDPDVATIDLDGVATGAAAGTTTITASLVGLTSNDAELTITDDRVVEIVVAPLSATLHAGSTETAAFTATAIYPDATAADVTELAVWTSSDESVATVSNEPGSRGIVSPDATNRGTARIKAAWSGLSSDEAVVEVVPSETIMSIAVLPAAPAGLCPGRTRDFHAWGNYLDASTVGITADPRLAWTSSQETVATISNAAGSKGVVTGVAPGAPVTVTATCFGFLSDTSAVTVVP
ncbi:MAG: Ig-like domain-containing protein [Deltaproteobacteria bacterium]|nr:Ig-like domain-containing protein [Deltaproteobacteria bacterium]